MGQHVASSAVARAARLLLATAFVAAAAHCEIPTIVQAAVPGVNGLMAFISDRARGGGYHDVWVISTEPGSTAVQLTSNAGEVWDVHPAWSPDGTKLAFARFDTHDYEVFVMNADGSNVIQLTNNDVTDYEPAWSPDGQRIAYTNWDGDYDIWVMNADGSGKMPLTANATEGPVYNWDTEPDWSPDGSRIAFERDSEIYVMHADGSGTVQVTFNNQYDVAPQWHPDQSRLVYSCVSPATGFPEVCIVELASGAVTQITADGHLKWEPCWSPDGQYVAFQRKDDESEGDDWEIVVVNADGTSLVKLTDYGGWDLHPAWQPLPSTPEQQVEALIHAVDVLVDQGALGDAIGAALTAKLDVADAMLDQGNLHAAVNALQAFINQVNALVRSRRLSPSAAQALIDAAYAAIERIEGM